MADVDVIQTVTETKKTRKVKKTTKRRESADQGSEITITEVEQTTTENDAKDEGYVMNSDSLWPMLDYYAIWYSSSSVNSNQSVNGVQKCWKTKNYSMKFQYKIWLVYSFILVRIHNYNLEWKQNINYTRVHYTYPLIILRYINSLNILHIQSILVNTITLF